MDLIRKNSLPENEGHSILLCGTLLPHIVEELNEKEKLYHFSIHPVVEEDARKNKYADDLIMTIKDSITRVVVEAKLNVSENVNYAMKNDLVQLLLEAMYSDRQENNRQDKTLN